MEAQTEINLITDIVSVQGIEMAYCSFGRGNRIFVILPGCPSSR